MYLCVQSVKSNVCNFFFFKKKEKDEASFGIEMKILFLAKWNSRREQNRIQKKNSPKKIKLPKKVGDTLSNE